MTGIHRILRQNHSFVHFTYPKRIVGLPAPTFICGNGEKSIFYVFKSYSTMCCWWHAYLGILKKILPLSIYPPILSAYLLFNNGVHRMNWNIYHNNLTNNFKGCTCRHLLAKLDNFELLKLSN